MAASETVRVILSEPELLVLAGMAKVALMRLQRDCERGEPKALRIRDRHEQWGMTFEHMIEICEELGNQVENNVRKREEQ